MPQSLRLLPAALLGVGTYLLVSRSSSQSFVTTGTSARQSRTAMRGFKDDFYAWKDTLSKDDQALLLKQAQNEFNKKFRSGDDFKKTVDQEKIAAFGKVLQKFFDNEREDYKKEEAMRAPDYQALQKRAGQVGYDFGLKSETVEIDRDADRRWATASRKMAMAEQEGKEYPDSSPLEELFPIANDAEHHENNVKTLEKLKEDSKGFKDLDAMFKDFSIPAAGEDFKVMMPRVLFEKLGDYANQYKEKLEAYKKDHSESEAESYANGELQEEWVKTLGTLVGEYYEARQEVEKEVTQLKKFFRSQKEMPGKTKADIVKQIWKELPKWSDSPVPPLDEEMLADLAKEPASVEGEFKHNWGTAEKLYKSEAIDSFGNRYLLGVFEDTKDAEKAFDAWNKEYEKAGQDVKESMKNWAKQQEAELAEEQDSVDRIRKALEEARR
mmetsp:Transcript_56995/g.135914  ORF Transcript_56995/g.135914 Transcript_56995/m.135914 type:complete len:439 (-) Transcript_56995:73-1389(-)